MFGKVRIRKHERGLWFRDGDFHRLIGPGEYRFWSKLYSRDRDRVEVVNTLDNRFVHSLLDVLVEDPEVRDELVVVDLADSQRALVWRDERLVHVLGPGRYAFWKSPYRMKVETFDVSDFVFEHSKIEAVIAHSEAGKWLQGLDIESYEDVLLFRDGELVKTLTQGRYVFWKGSGRIVWKSVDRREQLADVSGQEIMTADKVTLRVNLIVVYQVSDSVAAVTVTSDYAQALYREAQLALRASVGTQTLDALLSDKESVGTEVADVLRKRVSDFGLTVRSVGLRDIILPGEMKLILNQVIEAEKSAQANLIRRREETAAARSQANTAKLLAENPTLARMKELEILSEMVSGTRATFVFGQGELFEQVRSLVGKQADNSS